MLNALKTLPAPVTPAVGLFAKGKSLVSFYKSGITNIWHNRKLANELRQRCGASNALMLAQNISENAHLLAIEAEHANKQGKRVVRASQSSRMPPVTRSDFLTLLRTEHDMRKLPFFAVVFAVCFECTPLVLMAFPGIAPSTCWSKGYITKLRNKYTANLTNLHEKGAKLNGSESVFKLDPPQLQQLSQTLGLVKHAKFYPTGFLRSQVQKHLTIVRADDYFLRENIDKLDSLDSEELHRALAARALPMDGGVAALQRWLAEFKEPMDAGYLLSAKQG